MKSVKILTLLAGVAFGISACASTAPSHIPNPVTLPVSAAGKAVENQSYGASRRKVETFVETNHRFLIDEIALGGGPTLGEAMNLAGIDIKKRHDLTIKLNEDLFLYADTESLVVALMVHGN